MREITTDQIVKEVGDIKVWAGDMLRHDRLDSVSRRYHELIRHHDNGCSYAVIGLPKEADEMIVFLPGFGGRLSLHVLWKMDLVRHLAMRKGKNLAILILDAPYEHPNKIIVGGRADTLNKMYRQIIEEQQAKVYSLVGYSQGAVLALSLVNYLAVAPMRVICLDPSSVKQRSLLSMVKTFLSPRAIRSWDVARKRWPIYNKLGSGVVKDSHTKKYYGYWTTFIWGFTKPNLRRVARFMLRDHSDLLLMAAASHNFSLFIGGQSEFAPSDDFIRSSPGLSDRTIKISDADHGSFHQAEMLPWAIIMGSKQ